MTKNKKLLGSGEEIEMEVENLPFTQNVKIVKDHKEILKLLNIGTNMFIWPEFEKYILHDLNHFQAKSLVLIETIKVEGQILIYHYDKNTLYFGFFGVIDDNKQNIEFLIDNLIEYAKENNFKSIQGPINIPTIIYGWGFMEEGSSESLFVHKPVNSPIYNQIFRRKGFSVSFKEFSYEGYFQQLPSQVFEKYDFSDYEIVHFDNWDEVANIKKEFLILNARNLPPESVITPDSGALFDNYFDFIKQYGDPFMLVFVKYKKTNKFVGCILGTPNPFSKDKNNFFNSFVILAFVVDKKHRKKGIGWLLSMDIFENAWKHNILYCATTIGSHVVRTQEMSEIFGLSLKRTHVIFSYSL